MEGRVASKKGVLSRKLLMLANSPSMSDAHKKTTPCPPAPPSPPQSPSNGTEFAQKLDTDVTKDMGFGTKDKESTGKIA